MKPFLLFLFLGYSLLAMAQESGKPVDYSNPKAGDYIRVEGYLQDWCSGYLRPSLAYEMDEALDSMRLLPNWKFQIEVHTDCRASHAYNDTFSQRRADTLLAYYLMKGFPAWRITAKGMGERMLLMEKCSCDLTDYNNQICREAEHQLNRRTVIRLVGEIPPDHGMPINMKFPSVGQRKVFQVKAETLDSVCSLISITMDSIPLATYSITYITQKGHKGRVKSRRFNNQLNARLKKENVVWKVRYLLCEFSPKPEDTVLIEVITL